MNNDMMIYNDKIIKCVYHKRGINPLHFKDYRENFFQVERPKDNFTDFATSRSGMYVRNQVQAYNIQCELQTKDVVLALVGDAHRDSEQCIDLHGIKSVTDLLKEQEYTVLDYDATKTVHSNIAQDVIKEFDKPKVNTSQFVEVKQTGSRRFVSFLKPFFCCFGRC